MCAGSAQCEEEGVTLRRRVWCAHCALDWGRATRDRKRGERIDDSNDELILTDRGQSLCWQDSEFLRGWTAQVQSWPRSRRCEQPMTTTVADIPPTACNFWFPKSLGCAGVLHAAAGRGSLARSSTCRRDRFSGCVQHKKFDQSSPCPGARVAVSNHSHARGLDEISCVMLRTPL